MMLTRCPACQTVFRLHPEQLRARNGEVRCGHCFNPFNALQHRITTADDIPAEEGATQPPPSSGREPTPVAAAHLPAAPTAAATTLDFELPEFPPFDSPQPHAAPPPGAGRIAQSTAAEQPDADQHSAPEPIPSRGETAAAALRQTRSDEPSNGSALPEVIRSTRLSLSETEDRAPEISERTAAIAGPADAADAAAWPATAPDADERRPDAAAQADADDAVPQVPPAARHVNLEHLDATYGRPRRKHGAVTRTLVGMAAGLLAGMLAAQATYIFRMELTRMLPGVRPLLEAGCAALGCDVPLPHDVALIGIETSDLQSDPVREGRYVLFTTVRNRADYPQAWPHLELTLTDAGDTPVIRRVLTPAEWVPSGGLKANMPARATIPVRVAFSLEGALPTGYRVYVFYP